MAFRPAQPSLKPARPPTPAIVVTAPVIRTKAVVSPAVSHTLQLTCANINGADAMVARVTDQQSVLIPHDAMGLIKPCLLSGSILPSSFTRASDRAHGASLSLLFNADAADAVSVAHEDSSVAST